MVSGTSATLADLELHRLLDTIDEWAQEHGFGRGDPVDRPTATAVKDAPLTLDLTSGEIRTIAG